MKLPLLSLVAAVALTTPGVASSLIIRPDSVVQTQGGIPSSTTSFKAEFTLDHSGLSAPVNTGMGLSAALAVTHIVQASSDGAGAQSWQTRLSSTEDYFDPNSEYLPPILVYDLGAITHGLEGLLIWNNGIAQTQVNQGSVKTVEVRFSLDGITYSSLPLTYTVPAPPAGSKASPAYELPAQLAFGAEYSARFVQLLVTDNYFGEPGSAAGTGNRVGMGELRLYAVPEPGSLAFAAGALLAFGLPIFRRRSSLKQ